MTLSRLLFSVLFLFSFCTAKTSIAEDSLSLELFIGESVVTPENVLITNVEKKSGKFEIKGNSPSNKQLSELMKSLEGTKRLSDVDLLSLKVRKDKKQDFVIVAKDTTVASDIAVRRNVPKRNTVEYSTEQKEVLNKLKGTIEKSGSNLALTILSMQRHKFRQEYFNANSIDQEARKKWNHYDMYNPTSLSHRASKFSLKSRLYGGYFSSRNRTFSNELDILTGQRAINETLQVGSIGTGPRDNTGAKWIDISEVKSLKVKSHPWDEMLKESKPAAVPKILKVAPEDHYLLYFSKAPKISELEQALKEIFSFGRKVYDLDEMLSLRKKVSKRLGIEKFEKLETLIDEVAFISEDISFYPATHYAIAMKFNSDIMKNLSSYFPGKSDTTHGDIGDYFVVASSPELFSKIKNVNSGSETSLYDAKDMQYMLTVLDNRYDGFAYFSEQFILKLVSPEHRINAARRNVAINKLEALQYTVLAYKVITGKWAKSFEEIVRAGFIKENSVSEDYQIDSNGFVSSKLWGSLEKIKALSEVEISKITKAEKTDYVSFRDGYRNFWRRFFDPIGIGVTVSDNLYFHTVILPLIDNSEYNVVNAVSGGKVKKFESLSKPLRLPAITLHSNFNFDELLISTRTEFNRRRNTNDKVLNEEEIKASINKDLNKNLKTEKPLDVFGIIGDELTLGIGGSIPLALANIADFDFYIGLQLKKVKEFKNLINAIYASLYRNFAGGQRRMFLQLSSTEPLKNQYKDKEYYIIPTGFVNLYYFFNKDFVYFSISQLAVNRLIDSVKKSEKLTQIQKRGLDYVGEDQNILLLADLTQLKTFREQLAASKNWFSRATNPSRDIYGYLTDASTLGQKIKDDNLIRKYFSAIPESYSGVKIWLNNGQVFFGDNKEHGIDQVEFPVRFYTYSRHKTDSKEADKVKFEDLVPASWNKELQDNLGKLDGAALGLKITEDGLNTKLALTNPMSADKDPRF